MGIPGSANPMLLAGAAGAYQIDQSLRFNSADSAYLNRTPAAGSNRQTFTLSFWIKKTGPLAADNYGILGNYTDGNNNNEIYFNSQDRLLFYDKQSGTDYGYGWTLVFRDPSAWYHIVIVLDTTNATAADRLKLYVNGARQTDVSLDYGDFPLNHQVRLLSNSYTHYIGRGYSPAEYGNYYLAEYNLVDGTALTPSSFGETDTITGAWIPKKYSGSYGTNGFYLKFDPAATNGIGHDHSGNGNNFTATGFSTSGTGTDVMSDTPTNNWCTLNPLEKGSVVTLSNGNLDYSFGSASQRVHGTVGVSSGKWYWEETKNSGTYGAVGISLNVAPTTFTGNDAYSWSYNKNGNKYHNGTGVAYGATWDSGDTIGVAFDADAGSLEFYKNGTSQGTAYSNIPTGNTYFPACGDWGVNGTVNFGQRAFAYTPPTGFKALNTANLPEPTIKDGGKYFDTKLYTGTGASQSITGLGFSPDLVWIKSRTNPGQGFYHHLIDSVRGVSSGFYSTLYSNTTEAENTYPPSTYGGVTSLNSNGFSLGNSSGGGTWLNNSTTPYAAWCWDAGGAGSSNTAGSITSTVSANASAGFSIVTYTGNSTAGATVGHGLGVAPSMIITKARGATSEWGVYHSALGGTKALLLNQTYDQQTSSAYWNNTNPSSTLFTLGSGSTTNNSTTYVAYCFSEVAGYSKFGSYVGNGSSDGPFVFCGFRPAWVMIKVIDEVTTSWMMRDTARNPYNIANAYLFPNLSSAEFTNLDFDIYSNGFKPRNANNVENASGKNYIFAAFAELPFKYANAR